MGPTTVNVTFNAPLDECWVPGNIHLEAYLPMCVVQRVIVRRHFSVGYTQENPLQLSLCPWWSLRTFNGRVTSHWNSLQVPNRDWFKVRMILWAFGLDCETFNVYTALGFDDEGWLLMAFRCHDVTCFVSRSFRTQIGQLIAWHILVLFRSQLRQRLLSCFLQYI